MRHLRNFRIGQSGFSLIEMLFVTGIISLTGLGAMQLMDYIQRGSTDMMSKVSTRDLVEDVRSMMKFTEVCTANFNNLNVTAAPHNRTTLILPLPSSPVRYQQGLNYENGSLQLLGITLRQDPAAPFSGTRGVMELQLRLRKLQRTGTSPEITRIIPLDVSVNGSNGIVSCSAISPGGSADAQGSCENMGGRFIPGGTPGQGRCFFPQVMVSDDPNLMTSPALLHVRPGTVDALAVTPARTLGINYPANAVPTDAGTSFFVNGNFELIGKLHSSRVLTPRLLVAENPADLVTDPYLAAPPGAIAGKFRLPNGSNSYYGVLAPNADLWSNGGSGGNWVISFTNPQLGQFYHNGVNFSQSMNPSIAPYAYPYGSNNDLLAIRPEGRVGIGYTTKMGVTTTYGGEIVSIPPSACPLPVGISYPDAAECAITTHPYPPLAPPVTGGQFYVTDSSEGPCKSGETNYSNVRFFVREGALIEGSLYVGRSILGTVTTLSDRRLKMDFQPINDALSKVRTIDGVSYGWKRDLPKDTEKEKRDIGFIAQAVKKSFPQAVIEDSKGFLYVNYPKLIPVLWQAFKQYLNRVKKLENRVSRMEQAICRENPHDELCDSLKSDGLKGDLR